MSDQTTPTTSPATAPVPAPAPASPQSVRIETTLWWEDYLSHSSLLFKPSGDVYPAQVLFVDSWEWSLPILDEDITTWHSAPTREAAKAAALQAVMDAIGALEVKGESP